MEIVVYKDLKEMPEDLFETCTTTLTMRSRGLMEGTARWLHSLRDAGFWGRELWELPRHPTTVSVAIEDGTPVGWMFVDHQRSVEMYVNPLKRGQGIAARLLIALSEAAAIPLRQIDVYNYAARKAVKRAIELKGGQG